MVEIGNFDAFYPQGRIFGAEEVLELTRQTRALLPEVVLSVTVPTCCPWISSSSWRWIWWRPAPI